MKIELTHNQFLMKPDKGRSGMEFQVFTHGDIQIGLLLSLYEIPCIELKLPLFTFYLGWSDKKWDFLDDFFKPIKE